MSRFVVVSRKPFAEVEASLAAAIGRPDTRRFMEELSQATSWEALTRIVDGAVGPSGLVEFVRFELGSIFRFEHAGAPPRILRLVVGNPVMMKRIVSGIRDAGSYTPTTILVDERADGVHLSYDRMVGLLAGHANDEALAAATELDAKVERVLTEAAGAGPATHHDR